MIHIRLNKRTPLKKRKRLRNKARLRKKIMGTAERPRLVVFRSQKHLYVQLVNDVSGFTIEEISTLKLGVNGSNCAQAKLLGSKVAEAAKEKKIQKIVFDRNGFIYHGRVKVLAEAAREGGLVF